MAWAGPGLSFTLDGNAAPPMPTMPAQRMRSRSSGRVTGLVVGQGSGRSVQASRPSLSITMQRAGRPEGCGTACSAISATTPEVGACSAALT